MSPQELRIDNGLTIPVPRKRGRPATGLGRDGEPFRIRDYPRLRITVRPATKERLMSLAQHEARPVWKIVEDSINLYVGKMAAQEPDEAPASQTR